jgi:predicted RNA methylase
LLTLRAAASREIDFVRPPAGVHGGLIAHLGCGTGELTLALGAGPGRLVQGLDPDPK